jgi:hypothetical protein
MANQFEQQLGYYQAILEEGQELEIDTSDTWTSVELSVTTLDTYNTQTYRGAPKILVKGLWKFDMSFTMQGATNNDLGFRIGGATIGQQAYLIWNGRGGNNWSLNYSALINVPENENMSYYVNNFDANNNMTMKSGIFTAIRLY